ncbi:exocyst complex component 3-like protein 4 [Centroberyx affinis]|uniref:exocyst complex component 3-like protein 4 n=1 Tax=Centroberyx affinis TaxID=166261 RepID=UPI003A5C5B3F
MAGMEGSRPGDEDRLSIKSDGKTPKETLGTLKKSFRESLRRVGEKSPLSPNSKGSKVRRKSDTAAPNGDPGRPQAPLSPSPSAGSPMASPLKSIGGFFQKKEEDGTDGSSPTTQKPLAHSRTRSDPTFGDQILKRGASIRRSLGLGKKDKEKTLVPVSEVPVEEKKEEEEPVWEEIEESYALPEIPLTPLSVMQINKLIDMEVLEEAHLNLLSLRQEFQQERQQCGEDDSPVDLVKKEKDLSLLYGELRDKVKALVRDSNSFPSRNKGLLVHVARIIQEEEKREGDPGGVAGPGGWRDTWREAVGEGVRAKLGSVHLDGREQNQSWLAVHLGVLGKAIVEDLELVRRNLRWSYPPSFNVFSTYVRSYHTAVGQHLKKLEQEATELKDLYALLDWIINRYKSEKIMGSASLRPEMERESAAPCLEDGFLEQLKEKYCRRAQEDMRSSLEKIIEIEDEDVWRDRKTPELDEDFQFNSQFPMDIWTKVKGNAVNSRKVDAHLEVKVVSSCLEELKHFPKRFESESRRLCRAADVPAPLWTDYQITYINSFTVLKQHMEGYRDSCPAQVDQFSKEVNCLLVRLGQGLGDQYKDDVKPYLKRMMTRKWLTNDEDFQKLYSRTEKLSQHCALMKPPFVQTFVSGLHYHMVKEYVGQLMKNNYSCKNRKHEKAASKIREQWDQLRQLFTDMKSTHEWLHPLGDDLSDIIRQKNKRDIKDHLRPLVEHYPDISKKHLSAVLYFRGLVRGRERQLILQRLAEMKRNLGAGRVQRDDRVLFGDMQVTVNTDCLSDLPFSCLTLFLPDD